MDHYAMWDQILFVFLSVLLTIVIHGFATRFIVFITTNKSKKTNIIFSLKTLWLSVYITILILASFLEANVWAANLYLLGAIDNYYKALYFSIVTYTTLGYGDIVLDEPYRLMASIQAANGIIIFGWSTAIIVAVVQRYYFKR